MMNVVVDFKNQVPALSTVTGVTILGIGLSTAIRISAPLVVPPFLPARRYASAGTSYGPVSVCLSLCLSVTSRSSIQTAERIELVFGMGASFDLSYSVL